MHLKRPLAPSERFAFDAVCIGESGLDRICQVPRWPGADDKVSGTGLLSLVGGQAATAAVAIARLGFRARYIGAIGDDTAGAEVSRALGVAGVDAAVIVKPGVPTRQATVLVDQSTGQRAVIDHRHPGLVVSADELADDQIGSARLMLLDGSDMALSMRAAAIARLRGIRTVVDLDAARADSMNLLRLVDVVILPGSLVMRLTERDDIRSGLRALEAQLPNSAVVVATLGAEGAVARSGGKEMQVRPFVVDAVDTTGAGDAFRAGFAAAWLRSPGPEPDLADLLDTAAIVAGLNCRQVGAQSGLPAWADVEDARARRV